jgi:hypothetical protein
MSNTQLLSKAQIRDTVARGELREALAAAVHYAEFCQSAVSLNAFQAAGARLEQNVQLWGSHQISYEEFARMQAQISHTLLEWTDRLPNEPKPGAGRKKMLTEARLQNRLLWLFIACKGFVLGWVWFRWTQTGALDTERAMTLFGVLTPTFVATLYAMLDYYLHQHKKTETARYHRVVSGPLVNISYILLPLYAATMWYVLNRGVIAREWNFATMATVMSGLETAFGGVMAKLTGSFFRTES